jgi:hypothetical protein
LLDGWTGDAECFGERTGRRCVLDSCFSPSSSSPAIEADQKTSPRADEDLAHLYISDSITGKVRSTADHQQAELLLEYCEFLLPLRPPHPLDAHFLLADERRLDETSESCERLSSLLAEVDGNISLVLASTRVRLQNLELQTAIGTLALGTGATVAGFFGSASSPLSSFSLFPPPPSFPPSSS